MTMDLARTADNGLGEQPFAIVEDHALIASMIEDIARTMGACTVGHASKISDALTLTETAAWDVALLDLKVARGEMTYPVADQFHEKAYRLFS